MKTFCSSLVVIMIIGVICRIVCKVYGISLKLNNFPMFDQQPVVTEHKTPIQVESMNDVTCEENDMNDRPTAVINQNVIQILNRYDGSVKDEMPLPAIPLTGMIVGRAKDSDITINEEVIGRHHCLIGEDEDGIYIQDINSKNGIYYSTDITKRVRRINVKLGEIFYIANIPVRICLRNQIEPICDMSQNTKVFKNHSKSAEEALARV